MSFRWCFSWSLLNAFLILESVKRLFLVPYINSTQNFQHFDGLLSVLGQVISEILALKVRILLARTAWTCVSKLRRRCSWRNIKLVLRGVLFESFWTRLKIWRKLSQFFMIYGTQLSILTVKVIVILHCYSKSFRSKCRFMCLFSSRRRFVRKLLNAF